MFTGFEHTAVESPDPERLGEWYVNHLGCNIDRSGRPTKGLVDAGPVNVAGNRLVFFTGCDGNFLHPVRRKNPLP